MTETQIAAGLADLARHLALLDALDADRKAVVIAPDQGGRGTPDADRARVAQVDRGSIAAARAVESVLSRCAYPQLIRDVGALCGVHHTPDAAGLRFAEVHAPALIRDRLRESAAMATEAEKRHGEAMLASWMAKRLHGAHSREALDAVSAELKARAALHSARVAEKHATARLLEWGRARIVVAVDAWMKGRGAR